MRKTNKRNRWLALALCLCLLTGVFPLSGRTYAAAEQGCNHVHDTAVCGYTETVEGQPCTFTHAHDDTCGYARAVAAAPCSVEAAHIHDESCGGDPDTGEGCAFTHVHDGNCGWAGAKEAVPCSVEAAHIHDTSVCGYVEEVAGQPCNHVHDENCGGLTPDSGTTPGDSSPCTLTEGCKLPDGHEGECETDDNSVDNSLTLFTNETDTATFLSDSDTTLEVAFNDNSGGGSNLNNNQMRAAVDSALGNRDKTKITTLRLTGSASEITSWNWRCLMELYDGSEWTNLSVMDLSGMTGLKKVENSRDSASADIINLTSVQFPEGLQTIENSAFSRCVSLESVTFPVSLQTIGQEAFASCSKLTSMTFRGENEPSLGSAAFGSRPNGTAVPLNGTLHHPANAANAYASGIFGSPELDDWTRTVPINPTDGYSLDDVAVINEIIQNSDLGRRHGWETNNPSSWNTKVGTDPYLEWTYSAPKQITTLSISGIGLVGTLNVSGCNALTYLSCNDNNLKELDVSNLSNLESLYCSSNANMNELKVYGCNALIYLTCPGNDLKELDVSNLSNLERLSCDSNANMNELKVYGCDALTYLSCYGNDLKKLDVSNLSKLTRLSCYSNANMNELKVYGCNELKELSCYGNDLKELDVSNLSNLESLSCYSNANMNELKVYGCNALKALYCDGNALKKLDVSNLSNLERLYCNSNANMNELKVYGCNALKELYCYGNALKELDVSNLSKLQKLSCYDNPFQSLKLPGQDELKITVSPANSGKVMFSYDHDLTSDFLDNKNFTLTATAETGYSFDCWTGGTDEKNPVNRFTLSGSMSVTANFTCNAPTTYALEIQADTGGQMIQGTDDNYAAGANIPLKAKADTGYVFAGWTSSNGGSFVDEDSAETTFIMPGNPTTITAHFKPELTVPGITGDVSMNVAYGYAATSSRTFTLTGNPLPAVTSDEDYGGRITWNGTTNKLDIASGLGVGTYPVVLTAGNGVDPDASLTFTLTVEGESSVITGPTEATLTQGYAASSTGVFTFTGNPKPTVEKTSGNAAITWNGTERKLEIAAGLPVGVYPVTLTASNGVQPDAAITFTLTVLAPPTHEIIDGGRIEVKPGEDYSVTFKGDFKTWKSIRLNGVEMKIVPQSGTRSDLTYPGYTGNAGRGEEGSVKITLYKEFLATLPAGVCKLELGFEDGGVQTGGETEFKLLEEVNPKPEDPKPDDPKPTPDTTPAPKPENPSDVPPTGDNRPVGLLLALTALSGSTLLIIYGVSRKKKRIGKFHKES